MEGQEMPRTQSVMLLGIHNTQHTIKALQSPAEKKMDFTLFPKDT